MCETMESWTSVFTDPVRFLHLSSPARQIIPIPAHDDDEPAMVEPAPAAVNNVVADDDDEGYCSSNSGEDVYIDDAMNEYFDRMIARESRLVLETVYPLDRTTNVSVGASPARDFMPVVKLTRCAGGIDAVSVSVVITVEDWPRVIEYISGSKDFLTRDDDDDDDVQLAEPRTIVDIRLSQQVFLNRNCVKVEVGDRRVYLKTEGALTLLGLTPIINSHLYRLNHLDLHGTYINLLHATTHSSPAIERFKTLTCLLDPTVASAMLELVHFQASRLYNDYECMKAQGVEFS